MKKIREEKINFDQIKSYLKTAGDKINKADQILGIDQQASFQMAYEAMLRASLGFMLSFGQRPRSTLGHHKIIIDFVSEKLGKDYKSMVKIFDMMRRKRNELIYEPISSISEKEAKEAIKTAKKYIVIICEEIEKHHPQLKLF